MKYKIKISDDEHVIVNTDIPYISLLARNMKNKEVKYRLTKGPKGWQVDCFILEADRACRAHWGKIKKGEKDEKIKVFKP